jgi:hypothetical protein
MRRLVLLLVAALSLALPTAAQGDKPSREFLPNSDITLGPEFCGFELQLNVLVNKEYILTKSNGDQIITGTLKLRLVNSDTGASTDANISGPVFVDASTGTTTLRGNSLIFLAADESPTGEPIVWLTSGAVVFSASGVTFPHHHTDVCALLS